MGIFSKKDKDHKHLSKSQAQAAAEDAFNESYKQQLRHLGKVYFQSLIDKQSDNISKDIKNLTEGFKDELKAHVADQLDLMLSKISKDITDQANQHISEYRQASTRSQELVTQSLHQNAQAIFAKYQQMIKNMEQIVSEQEKMMAGVFQDNKTHILQLQAEQDKSLRELRGGVSKVYSQTEELNQTMKATISSHTSKLKDVYEQNLAEANRAKESQGAAIKSLSESVAILEQQHKQLKQLMDTALEKQKALIADTVNQHMSKIVEHYIITTLGDSSDITTQLPSILEKLNASKQAMQEDMKL